MDSSCMQAAFQNTNHAACCAADPRSVVIGGKSPLALISTPIPATLSCIRLRPTRCGDHRIAPKRPREREFLYPVKALFTECMARSAKSDLLVANFERRM